MFLMRCMNTTQGKAVIITLSEYKLRIFVNDQLFYAWYVTWHYSSIIITLRVTIIQIYPVIFQRLKNSFKNWLRIFSKDLNKYKKWFLNFDGFIVPINMITSQNPWNLLLSCHFWCFTKRHSIVNIVIIFFYQSPFYFGCN